LSKSKS